MKISNWTIKRSGASMTIHGVRVDTGKPIKVTNVDVIEAGKPAEGVEHFAMDNRDVTYELV